MKTSCFVVALLAFGILNIQAAQTTATSTGASQIAVPEPTAYRVVDAGANHRVWQNETYEKSPDGQIHTNIHTYTELASGLNYLKAGQWVEAKEQIEILPQGGAAAVQGQHQAYFPGDIYQGQIELVTPDGQHLKSRPLGLSYDDGSNTVFIAVLTNSIGQLVGSNQVIYPDAFIGFNGFKGDLVFTYTKAGFEQDIILRAQPPTPESLGLNPATAKLQVLTEFFSPPQPAIQARKLAAQAGLSLTDQSLGFGAMQMVPGRAFLLGNNAVDSGAQVGKQWLLLDGRQFLVEEVPVDAIADGLATLPLTAMQSGSSKASHTASRHLALPPQRLVKNTSKTMLLAKAALPTQGFVLDYVTINTTNTYYSFTFQGDTTYYISGNVVFTGSGNVTVEGGAVLKYAPGAQLTFSYPPVWQASAYRPVIFTAKDDNTVGETISGSTGNPTGYYASCALFFGYTPTTISNFRISYAQTAITLNSYWNTVFSNGQIVNCGYGFYFGSGSSSINLTIRNMLFANVYCDFYGIPSYYSLVDAQNATFSGGYALVGSPGYYASLRLKNCILANVASIGITPSGNNNGFYKCPQFGTGAITNTFYPFQTAGAGAYYLTNGCNFLNAGATNIDATLLAGLKQKTTYPPIVYSNLTFSVATNFSPQARRDTNSSPDLGYHYDPIDYFFGGVTASSNVTFAAGTAAGWFELPGSGGPGYGIALKNDIFATFNGTATSPCVFARYDTVQEGGNGLWKDKGWLGGMANGDSYDTNNPAGITATFTRFSYLASDPNHFRDGTNNQPIVIQAKHCEFYGGAVGRNILAGYTNCLFYRAGFGISTASAYPYQKYINCTFYGGSLAFGHSEGGAPYWYSYIHDCAFDGTTFSIGHPFGSNTNYADYNYNAFNSGAAQPPTEGANTVSVTGGFNWQSSWLGNFYQPTNSPLIDKGDRTADQVGLYHFTTQTNQVKEANSIVDIGYHYVAVDAYGNPLDTNGNGIPDYLEDANGNGIFDAGDLGDWKISPFGLGGANALQVFTPLK